jgi:hypothetical protein
MRSGRSAWALVAGNRTTVTLLLLTSAWAPAATRRGRGPTPAGSTAQREPPLVQLLIEAVGASSVLSCQVHWAENVHVSNNKPTSIQLGPRRYNCRPPRPDLHRPKGRTY